jgi:RNA-directed DNA polymerase
MTKVQRRNLRLIECRLYAVESRKDLAHRLSTKSNVVTVEQLDALAPDVGNFKLFSIKKNGKERPVQEPKPSLQHLHARVHKLLSRIEAPKYLHSAVRGRSYLSNANVHAPDTAVIKIDVKKFFPSVPRHAVFRFFSEILRCRRDVAGLLADLLTFDAHLPTGSSASPIISFYAFKPMFDEIEKLATTHGLKMSCYVDDIIMSGANATKAVLFEARGIIRRHGLKSHKTRIFAPCNPKVITGVCITSSGMRVPNKLHLRIKQGFDALATAKTAKARQKALSPLLGRLEAAGQIEVKFRARATTLRASFCT